MPMVCKFIRKIMDQIMLIITLQSMAALVTLLVTSVSSMSKCGITPIIQHLTSEFLVFDLEYTLRIFFSFFNLSTVLIWPGFSDLKVILLFHLCINAKVWECLKLLHSLYFIEKYKGKKKREATWRICPAEIMLMKACWLYFIVQSPKIYKKILDALLLLYLKIKFLETCGEKT